MISKQEQSTSNAFTPLYEHARKKGIPRRDKAKKIFDAIKPEIEGHYIYGAYHKALFDEYAISVFDAACTMPDGNLTIKEFAEKLGKSKEATRYWVDKINPGNKSLPGSARVYVDLETQHKVIKALQDREELRGKKKSLSKVAKDVYALQKEIQSLNDRVTALEEEKRL